MANHGFSLEGSLRRTFSAVVAFGVMVVATATPAGAQNSGKGGDGSSDRNRNRATHHTLPGDRYDHALRELRRGDYQDALKEFHGSARGAFKGVHGLWIDSICHTAMIGEANYRLGRPAEALEYYDRSLQLFLAYPQWMLRVNFPAQIFPSKRVEVIRPDPWSGTVRRAGAGNFPNSIPVAQGRINNEDRVRQGGVVEAPMYRTVRVDEVVRCTALSLRRRRELLGPLCEHDPLTEKLVAAANNGFAPGNHWSITWNNMLTGLIFASAGRNVPAIAALRNAELVGGQYDHPLTGDTLLALAELSLEAGQLDAAANYALQASIAAYRFHQYDAMEESLRLANTVHLISGKREPYPPLERAANWAKIKNADEMAASLKIAQAEGLLVAGKLSQARATLAQVRSLLSRREMARGVLGARYAWQEALAAYLTGNAKSAEPSLAAALKTASGASTQLFQIQALDKNRSKLDPRLAMELYEKVLREPTPTDWATDPMHSTAVLITPHATAYEHWFEIALARKAHEKALEIADRTRRHRFLTSQPLGGRLLSLRWLLAGPPETLDKAATVHRQDLLVRYPLFKKASDEADAIRAALRAEPLAPEGVELQRSQRTALGKLAHAATAGELLIRQIAMRREHSPMLFPPIRPMTGIQSELKRDQAMWVFFATSTDLYAMMIAGERYDAWRVAGAKQLRPEMSELLKKIGNYDQNHQLDAKRLESSDWKTAARAVTQLLVADSQVDLSRLGNELIIVPDGPLWYLPFELLQVGKDDQAMPLLSKVRVRYAPTASLAFPFLPPRQVGDRIGVTVGQLHARDGRAAAEATFERISRENARAARLSDNLPAPSPLYVKLIDGLVVLDDIDDAPGGPYAWSPTQVERSPAAGALSQWFSLPFGGPRTVVLPGFHTAAESALRVKGPPHDGQDVFLSVCGLMSTGTETVLLSRWRTGGKSSCNLVYEFIRELPHTGAADAWQRSVQLVRETALDPEMEPRVSRLDAEEIPRANHPLFWSGYMLIDSGERTPPPRAAGG